MINSFIKKLKKNKYINSKHVGYNANKYSDINDLDLDIIERVKPFTMTSLERIIALLNSVEHIEKNKILGSIVECGVWKGGSIMASICKLLQHNSVEREIWLYDTFDGMSEPLELDKDPAGITASERLANAPKEGTNIWAYSTLEEVKNNVLSLNYPSDKIVFIKGMVEYTLLKKVPENIAILRLDTDWYESTKIELEILYDRVVSGGIIIIDDYGHWAGCKKAVDEFIDHRKLKIFMHRIDYSGRLIVKP